jgi:hypothetical protein
MVLRQLLQVKEETGHSDDIVTLSARWQALLDEEIEGAVSNDEISRMRRRFNKDSLRIIAAINRELRGEKVETGILDGNKPLPAREFSFRAMVFSITTGILLAVIGTGLFLFQPEPDCSANLDLSGTWDIIATIGSKTNRLGTVNITHDACTSLFLLSGEVRADDNEPDTDFTAQIGGYNAGQLQFTYENFDGERGVCRGVTPVVGSDKFTVQCIDLIGFDYDLSPNTKLVFQRSLADRK